MADKKLTQKHVEIVLLMYKLLISRVILPILTSILKIIDTDYAADESFEAQTGLKKFTHTIPLVAKSDFANTKNIFRTIPYNTYYFRTSSGKELTCADKHILIDGNNNQVFCENLMVGDKIKTKDGVESIVSNTNLNIKVNMYDLEIDSEDHLYYSNDILSHNTTVTTAYLLWVAMFQPDKTILVVGNKLSTAIEIMDRIKYSYEQLPDWLRDSTPVYNVTSVKFSNGSKIICRATSKSSANGLSVSILYCDELSKLAPRIQQEFWSSVRPTLSTGGRCIVTSTPDNDEDLFAQIWKGACNTIDEFGNQQELGSNGFKAIKAIWSEHPDRDEAWATAERHAMGEEKFLREHCGEFISEDSTLIDAMALTRLKSSEPKFTTGAVRWYKPISPDKSYLVHLDPSTGTGGDYAAIQIFEMPTMEQVGEWMHNKTPQRGQVQTIINILRYIQSEVKRSDPDLFWSFENNACGEGILQLVLELGEEKFPGNLINEPKTRGHIRKIRRGLVTTNRTKLLACTKLKSLVDSDKMILHSTGLIYQLKNYVSTGISFAGKPGINDDLVASTLGIIRLMIMAAEWGSWDSNLLREEFEEDYEPMVPIINIF